MAQVSGVKLIVTFEKDQFSSKGIIHREIKAKQDFVYNSLAIPVGD